MKRKNKWKLIFLGSAMFSMISYDGLDIINDLKIISQLNFYLELALSLLLFLSFLIQSLNFAQIIVFNSVFFLQNEPYKLYITSWKSSRRRDFSYLRAATLFLYSSFALSVSPNWFTRSSCFFLSFSISLSKSSFSSVSLPIFFESSSLSWEALCLSFFRESMLNSRSLIFCSSFLISSLS